jgi:hypothetical protein
MKEMRRKTTFLITWRKSGILTVKWLWNSSFLLCSFKILEDLELQTSNVHFTWHLLSCKGWQGFYEPRQVRKDFHVTFSSFLTWEKFDSQMSTKGSTSFERSRVTDVYDILLVGWSHDTQNKFDCDYCEEVPWLSRDHIERR